jgi:hypothetical protein
MVIARNKAINAARNPVDGPACSRGSFSPAGDAPNQDSADFCRTGSVARNKAINAALCQQFSQRSVRKIYSALLCGHLADDDGVINALNHLIM